MEQRFERHFLGLTSNSGGFDAECRMKWGLSPITWKPEDA
jgi:hypothetical protein